MSDPVVGRASPFKARGPFRGIRAPFRGIGVWGRYPARTNSIRNNTMQGAVAGSPGTLPTNWGNTGSTNGLTRTIVGTGTENGLPYIDYRFSGTPTGTGSIGITFDSSTAITTANGETWSRSMFLQLVGGSKTNLTSIINWLVPYTSTPSALTAHATNVLANVDATQARVSTTHTLALPTVAYVQHALLVGYTSGAAIDVTLRIAAPQLERGAGATAPILTSGAAASRVADTLAGAY